MDRMLSYQKEICNKRYLTNQTRNLERARLVEAESCNRSEADELNRTKGRQSLLLKAIVGIRTPSYTISALLVMQLLGMNVGE